MGNTHQSGSPTEEKADWSYNPQQKYGAILSQRQPLFFSIDTQARQRGAPLSRRMVCSGDGPRLFRKGYHPDATRKDLREAISGFF
jgi:hypothetical protein